MKTLLGISAVGPDRLPIRAWRAMEDTIDAGVLRYDRRAMLPRLLKIWPGELDDAGEPEASKIILARLRRALRREWSLSRARHWAYDVNRHIALAQAWRAETARLRALPRSAATTPTERE